MALTNSRTTLIVFLLSVFWIQTAYSNAVAEDEGVPMTRLRSGERNRHRRATSSNNDDHSDRKLPQKEMYDFWKMVPKEMSMTNAPTQTPTIREALPDPTGSPTKLPTVPIPAATLPPTSRPTLPPTNPPTKGPTSSPSGRPTAAPSSSPTARPSSVPTGVPSAAPSAGPISAPTAQPTRPPTRAPTRSPTNRPTTSEPTVLPSAGPSSSSAPTAKRKKKSKRNEFDGAYLNNLSGDTAKRLWSQTLSTESFFGISDDNKDLETKSAASEVQAFGIPVAALPIDP
jgi:hypothetical protein